MSERLPDWVLSDPVAMQRVYELSKESIADEIAAFRVGVLPKECPDRDAQSAREVARLGQPIDMMLTGFRVGHRCQWEAWLKLVEERVEDPDHRRDFLERASRFLFEYVDRLSALVSEEHEQERERILRGAGQRRVQLVRELLDGAEVDSESLDWPLDHHHLGILAWAEGGDVGARQLAESLGRPLLIIEAGVEGTWFAWASASAPLSAAEERRSPAFAPPRAGWRPDWRRPGPRGFGSRIRSRGGPGGWPGTQTCR